MPAVCSRLCVVLDGDTSRTYVTRTRSGLACVENDRLVVGYEEKPSVVVVVPSTTDFATNAASVARSHLRRRLDRSVASCPGRAVAPPRPSSWSSAYRRRSASDPVDVSVICSSVEVRAARLPPCRAAVANSVLTHRSLLPLNCLSVRLSVCHLCFMLIFVLHCLNPMLHYNIISFNSKPLSVV